MGEDRKVLLGELLPKEVDREGWGKKREIGGKEEESCMKQRNIDEKGLEGEKRSQGRI